MSAVMVVVLTRASMLVEFMSVSRFVGFGGSFPLVGGVCWSGCFQNTLFGIDDSWAKE
jgi:hypothetical protein